MKDEVLVKRFLLWFGFGAVFGAGTSPKTEKPFLTTLKTVYFAEREGVEPPTLTPLKSTF
ncbi:hypothetical protein [Sphingobacterium sp. BIGb0116]|uniref:hypothetical protein n=1 Tax=Sphingobacterium sp. BIGb0116 TaxID=2940619 RepID=UPI00216A9704|nr:hypothetical protein [Sphingobacterium sp. BIGb0116]MCS4164764.1 hypothetical protein [Sphingobacterium sp. BIGb0116]